MQRRRHILRTLLVVTALAVAVVAVAGSSLGLRVNRKQSRARHHQPRLVTMEGVLHQDRLGSWVLDDKTPLRQSIDLRWQEERTGRDGSPSAGRLVRLTGQWYGGVFKVSHATLLSPNRAVQRQMILPVTEPGREFEQLPE